MAAGVQKAWSATASSNANSDSNINFAEGQAPSTVNDSARAVMAGVKAFANQIGGAKTSGGTSNAYTFTSDSAGAISTAYAAGMFFRFKADKTNTGAATFNADAVGAVDIRKGGAATALVAGDIVQNGIYDVSHNGTYFILLNPETGQGATGFQAADATLTALAALSTAADQYIRATGTDTFTMDSLATVATKLAGAKASFSAHKNGSDQGSINSITETKITFGTEEFDIGGYYDTTNSRWTPPAGKVRISAAIWFGGSLLAAGQAYAVLYKNGAPLKLGPLFYGANTAVGGVYGNWLVDANGTDYFEIYFYGTTSSGAITVSGLAGVTYFQGEQV